MNAFADTAPLEPSPPADLRGSLAAPTGRARAGSRGAGIVNLIAVLLIGAALGGQILLSGAGLGTFQQAAHNVGPLVALGVLLALVAWLVTIRAGETSKAVVRLVAGLVLLAYSGEQLVRDVQAQRQLKVAARELLALQDTARAGFDDLGRRLEQVDLDHVLSPSSLAQAPARQAARDTLARYAALIDERHARLDAFYAELNRRIDSLPDGEFRDGARLGRDRQWHEIHDTLINLERAQRQLAHAMSGLLDWGEQQGATLQVRGTAFVFASVAQQQDLKARLADLQVVQDRYNVVVKETKFRADRLEKERVDGQRDLQRFFSE
jgi:hypothetical protein